ncbi:NAD-dependent epimerase/dehydratase family protein, partial [Salmonella enterica]|uniref:NAD-dependent epimerase/dehydratase family protein n=1 Tax=Salmonella enterica TaxID=28901 RepID=UPI00398C5C57
MQILITGGTGLTGLHLSPRLLTLGHPLTVVTRNHDNPRQISWSRVTLRKVLAERLQPKARNSKLTRRDETSAHQRPKC